jgi:putative transposase
MVGESSVRLPIRLLGYCPMPNHFHPVPRPHADGELSRWMPWLLTTHVPCSRKRHGHTGHAWRGRFHAFPIQDDEHLVTVVRYVERNPLRAGLVAQAQERKSKRSNVRFAAIGRLASRSGPVQRPNISDWSRA